MNLALGITEGLREIWAHKFRSVLTMGGVVFGVAALMAVFALTAGTAAAYRETLEQAGGLERIDVNDAPVPPDKENIAELSKGRTYLDAMAIRSSVPLVTAVSPEIDLGGAKVSRAGHQSNPRVLGAQYDHLIVERHRIAYGRFLTDLDQKYAHRVCVIGRTVVDQLWDEPNAVPLGQMVRINSETFRVVGIFDHYETDAQRQAEKLGIVQRQLARRKARSGAQKVRADDPFWYKNNSVIIPLTTMQLVFKSANVDTVSGLDAGPDLKLNRLTVQADIRHFDSALQQIRNVLTQTHHGIPDFGFGTREDWFDSIEQSIHGTKITFGLIAAITLLGGGLGITNIMLASITERVRELGIRRAIGARSRDVFGQILIESVVLAMCGGVIGLLFGLLLLQLASLLSPSQNAPILELSAVVISFSSSVGVGLVAGIYPAWKASLLSPIQALRYE